MVERSAGAGSAATGDDSTAACAGRTAARCWLTVALNNRLRPTHNTNMAFSASKVETVRGRVYPLVEKSKSP